MSIYPKKIECVLFDLYGTLFLYGDMRAAWKDWIEDLQLELARLGVLLSAEGLKKECDGFFSGTVTPLDGLTVYGTRLFHLAIRLGGKPTHTWCTEAAASTMIRWQSYIQLDPDAIPVLTELRHRSFRVGVLSNFDDTPHVLRLLEDSALTPLLDAIVVSDQVGLKKPDTRIFQHALSILGSPADRTAFIGDHPEQDFAGAEGAGLHAILIDRSLGGVDRLQMNFYANQDGGLDQGADRPTHRSISSLQELVLLLPEPQ